MFHICTGARSTILYDRLKLSTDRKRNLIGPCWQFPTITHFFINYPFETESGQWPNLALTISGNCYIENASRPLPLAQTTSRAICVIFVGELHYPRSTI
jgi:hypothetical protein